MDSKKSTEGHGRVWREKGMGKQCSYYFISKNKGNNVKGSHFTKLLMSSVIETEPIFLHDIESEDNPDESALSFHHVDSRDRTQASQLGFKHLCSLSHLTNLKTQLYMLMVFALNNSRGS